MRMRGEDGAQVLLSLRPSLYRPPDTIPTLSPTPADLLVDVIEVTEPPSSLLLIFPNPFHLHSCLG